MYSLTKWTFLANPKFSIILMMSTPVIKSKLILLTAAAAAAAKSLQSCPTLCDPIDGSPPGSTVPGILQARTLEWVAISFSNAWKWKVKVKSLSRVQLSATPWTAAHQAPPSMGFSRQEYWSGVPLPSPSTYCTTGQIAKRWGFGSRNTILFRKPADWEDGRLVSQNNHLIRVWVPVSFIEQS